jgi:hypothetical protein
MPGSAVLDQRWPRLGLGGLTLAGHECRRQHHERDDSAVSRSRAAHAVKGSPEPRRRERNARAPIESADQFPYARRRLRTHTSHLHQGRLVRRDDALHGAEFEQQPMRQCRTNPGEPLEHVQLS